MFFLNSAIGYHAIWSHNHEIANLLSKKWKVFWIDPVKVKGYPHFEQINTETNISNVKVINRGIFVKKLGIWYLLKSEYESIKHFLKLKKDVKYFVNYSPLGNFFAFLLAKLFRKKVISFYVDDYIALAQNKFAKFFYKITLPIRFYFSSEIFVTAKILEEVPQKYNKNIHYSPNGVNLKKIKIGTPKKLGVIKRVWFVWALWNWIDWDIIIELSKKYTDIAFDIVGNWEIYWFLEKQKKQYNLKNLNLYWFKPHKEALDIISKTEITIIPFKVNDITDAVSPVKLFEYWSLGKTTIVSNTLELKQFDKEIFIYKNKKDLFSIIEKIQNNTEIVYNKSLVAIEKLKDFDWSGNLWKNILNIILKK